MSLFDPNLLATANQVPAIPVPAFTGLGDDAWLAASAALAGVAHPSDMVRPFLPWQAAAYNFANDSIARWGGCLLGDDMGMGKTQVILALVADAVRSGGYAIAVAPTVAEVGYRSDLLAAFPHLRLHVVRGRKVDVAALPVADIYFISDDPLTLKAWMAVEVEDAKGKVHVEASAWARGAAIIARDEIHRDKGIEGKPNGVRTKVMMAVATACRAAGRPIVGATGTLVSNRPIESYLPLQIVGGDRLLKSLTPGANNASGYKWRYCNPVQVHVGKGQHRTSFRGVDVETCKQLHEYLRRTVYVRREKSDLGEGVLPHSGWLIAPQALPFSKLVKYDRVVRDLLNLVREEKGLEAMAAAERGKALVQMQMMWQHAGLAKAEAAVDYIANLVEQGEQVVAFYQHTEVMTHMMTALSKAGISYTLISGQVTDTARNMARTAAIEEFQAGDAKVCLAQIQSAGQAVTLTAACHAVFVQVPWAAGQIAQCAGRNLRVDDITRARAAAGGKVTWHVIPARYEDGTPTFDDAMWTVLENKALVCDSIVAGKEITMPDEAIYREAFKLWEPMARKRMGGW